MRKGNRKARIRSSKKLKQMSTELKRMEHLDFKDSDAVPFHLHIGMRTTKTVLAVLICGVIGWIAQEPPLFAMFSAVLCMQSSTDDTIKNGYNRILATIVGGLFSVSVLAFCGMVSIEEETMLYYAIIAFMMIPIIATTLFLQKPTTTALSCIVFIAVCLSPIDDMTPLVQAVQRTLDTLAGIVVTMFIELIFPYHPNLQEDEVMDQMKIEGWDN